MARKETKDTLGEISKQLSERQADIISKAINLRRFRVIDHTHFEVDGIPLYAQEFGEGKIDYLPLKQLCAAIGMSVGFYAANPGLLNVEIFKERFKQLDEEEGERMIRFKKTDKGNMLLSILPLAHQAPNYVDVIDPLVQALPDNMEIRLSNHTRVDHEHRLSMRISLLDYPIEITEGNGKEKCELGFFIDMSEDGRGGKMSMTSMLYNQWCGNGAMISYDHHPYFQYNYRGIRAVDLKAAINSVILRFKDDVEPVHSAIVQTQKTMLTKNQAAGFLKSLESRRDVSLGFIRKVRKEIESSNVEQISRWRVVNAITLNAQKLPYDGRIQHEFVAGHLLGLDLKQAA